jgi:hypothetical protein
MKINISNCKDPALRKEIRNAMNFWAEKLLKARLSANITVNIRFVPSLIKKEDIFADVGVKGPARYPRSFDMRITDKLSHRRTLMTLAHEFTHIKQYAKGELRDAGKGTRWMGENIDSDSLNYYDYPWEIEALGREIGLYMQWKSFKKQMNQMGKLL